MAYLCLVVFGLWNMVVLRGDWWMLVKMGYCEMDVLMGGVFGVEPRMRLARTVCLGVVVLGGDHEGMAG